MTHNGPKKRKRKTPDERRKIRRQIDQWLEDLNGNNLPGLIWPKNPKSLKRADIQEAYDENLEIETQIKNQIGRVDNMEGIKQSYAAKRMLILEELASLDQKEKDLEELARNRKELVKLWGHRRMALLTLGGVLAKRNLAGRESLLANYRAAIKAFTIMFSGIASEQVESMLQGNGTDESGDNSVDGP